MTDDWPTVDTPEQRQIKREWRAAPKHPGPEFVATVDVPVDVVETEQQPPR